MLNVATSKDALNRTTSYTYTSDKLPKTVTNPLLETATFGYDSIGNLNAVTDPRSKTTSYTQSGLANTNQVNPDTGNSNVTYNTAGLVATMTRANGVTTTYTYDMQNRLTRFATSGGSDSQIITYTYDICTYGKNRLCTITDSSGSISYTYKAGGQLATQISVINGASYSLSYEYDTYGRLYTETYPNGVVLRYSYNISNNVSKIEANITGTWQSVVGSLPYAKAQKWTFGNGSITTLSVDDDGRTQSIVNPGIQNLSYTYNTANEITGITNTINTSASQTYTYDGASRLASVTSGLGNQSWTYDANGNRSSHTLGGSTSNYSSPVIGNRLPSIEDTTVPTSKTRKYGYDANGNIISVWLIGGGANYTYDGLNRLQSLSSSISGGMRYLNNAYNQRVYKSAQGIGGGGTYSYLYNANGALVAETSNGASTIGSIYVYFQNQVVGLIRGGNYMQFIMII